MTPGQAKRKHLKESIGAFFNGDAPKGTASPYMIVAELNPSGVRNGMGPTGAYEYTTRVFAENVGEAYPSALAATIEALDQATTQQGEYQVFSHLLDPYEDAFSSADDTARQFRREGGDYRVLVRPIPAQEP